MVEQASAIDRQLELSTRVAWLRPLMGALAPAGRRGLLTILIFHRVHADADELFPHEMNRTTFRERMLWIREWFNVLPLEDAVTALGRGTLPARALSLTFDDGYADNAMVALPILRELGLHATFFVAMGFIDGGRMWNDTVIEIVRRDRGRELDLAAFGLGKHPLRSLEERRQAIDSLLPQLKYLPSAERQTIVDEVAAQSRTLLPDDLMMTRVQLRNLAAAGMGFGGHTISHPILARSDDETARREIAEGREALEAVVRQPVKLFAYPNGKPRIDYFAAHVQMVKTLGFAAAVSTARGAARGSDSPYELPRFTPWARTASRFGIQLTRNLLRPRFGIA